MVLGTKFENNKFLNSYTSGVLGLVIYQIQTSQVFSIKNHLMKISQYLGQVCWIHTYR